MPAVDTKDNVAEAVYFEEISKLGIQKEAADRELGVILAMKRGEEDWIRKRCLTGKYKERMR